MFSPHENGTGIMKICTIPYIESKWSGFFRQEGSKQGQNCQTKLFWLHNDFSRTSHFWDNQGFLTQNAVYGNALSLVFFKGLDTPKSELTIFSNTKSPAKDFFTS